MRDGRVYTATQTADAKFDEITPDSYKWCDGNISSKDVGIGRTFDERNRYRRITLAFVATDMYLVDQALQHLDRGRSITPRLTPDRQRIARPIQVEFRPSACRGNHRKTGSFRGLSFAQLQIQTLNLCCFDGT
jgi:hypothetical protein